MADKMVVVVATHGRSPRLEKLMESLLECEKPLSYSRVIIAENGPRGGAGQIVRRFEDIIDLEYVYVPEAGKSFGLNAAMRHLDDDVLMVYFDDDVRLSSKVLLAYDRATSEKGPGYYYGGPLGVDYEAEPPKWLLDYLPVSAKGWNPTSAHEHKSFYGANWAAYVGDIRSVGGYNVHIGAGTVVSGEETDIQERMRDLGIMPVYVPDASVWHYVPKDRSSPIWALKRAFRDGAYQGRKYRDQYPVVGAKGVLRYLAKSVLRSGAEIRGNGLFHAIHSFSHRIGGLYGKARDDQSLYS